MAPCSDGTDEDDRGERIGVAAGKMTASVFAFVF
jgi:hypothetical protein